MSQFTLKLGVLALTDSAPLVAAQHLGYFEAAGLDVRLERQSSWATLRDKLIVGELHMAQMLSPMPVAIQLGFGGCPQRAMRAPLVLNRGGNGLTVSRLVHDIMIDLGADETLGSRLRALKVQGDLPEGLTFGTVFPYSMHTLQLRRWLRSHDLDPDVDVRLRVVPPVRMVEALHSELIDGFCVGEPYNSMAEEDDLGNMVASSLDLWPNAPEKILGCLSDWALHNEEHMRLLCEAVAKACHWLEAGAENRKKAAMWLSESDYVNVPAAMIERALLATRNGSAFVRFDGGKLVWGQDGQMEPLVAETLSLAGNAYSHRLNMDEVRSIFA